MDENIVHYIKMWLPTFIIGLVIAAAGVIIFVSGFSRKNNTVRNNVFSITMLLCGLFLCIGFIPDNIVSDLVEYRKPLRLATNVVCHPICTAFGICMILFTALHIFMKARPNVYTDTVLKATSVIWGTITELCALAVISVGIMGFLNYMNI